MNDVKILSMDPLAIEDRRKGPIKLTHCLSVQTGLWLQATHVNPVFNQICLIRKIFFEDMLDGESEALFLLMSRHEDKRIYVWKGHWNGGYYEQ